MKKIFAISVFILTSHELLFGQYYYPWVAEFSSIYTPLSSTIEGIVYYPLSSDQYDDALYYISTFDSLTIEQNPTSTYNCHSYAWNISQNPNADVVWINQNNRYNQPNLEKYWTDGSYIEVSGLSTAEIIHYTGDHSAEKYTSSKYISKWGANCLIIHSPNNVPSIYGTSGDYYSSLKMDGPSVLCSNSNATFQTPDYLNCTFTWTLDTDKLEIISGQGTRSFTVTPKTYFNDGNSWVTLTLNIGAPINETRTITKNFWVGSPDIPVTNPSGYPTIQLSYGDYQLIRIASSPGAASSSAYWWSTGSVTPASNTNGSQCLFEAIDYGSGNFYVETSNDCGTSSPGGGSINVSSGEKLNMLQISPNPATNEIYISIIPKKSNLNDLKNITQAITDYELILYNSYGSAVFIGKMSYGSTKLNISGWQKGTYVIIVKNKDESMTAKFIKN